MDFRILRWVVGALSAAITFGSLTLFLGTPPWHGHRHAHHWKHHAERHQHRKHREHFREYRKLQDEKSPDQAVEGKSDQY